MATPSEIKAAHCAFIRTPPSRRNSAMSGSAANIAVRPSDPETGSKSCVYTKGLPPSLGSDYHGRPVGKRRSGRLALILSFDNQRREASPQLRGHAGFGLPRQRSSSTVPHANVCEPVTLNCTAPSRSTAVTPAAGAPSCHTTTPSIAIVRAWPSSGTTTVPDVPSGADIVWVNDESPPPRRQRETSGPDGVGTRPCAHFRLPGCGAMTQVL